MTTYTILIVEDEPWVAFFLSKALEHSNRNYHVHVVDSGEEAKEVLDDFPVDLLVVDLRLPGIDGLKLLEWTRSAHAHTRLVLMTAYGSESIEAQARQLGACYYLAKPFPVEKLIDTVHEALSKPVLSTAALDPQSAAKGSSR